jgi:Domain of unknown function (DUF4304)
MTAQETFRAMMKTQVAPRLRAVGFRGSGQHFELRSPDHWAMVGFQKSQFSDARSVRFTVNVMVVSRAVWDARRRIHPWLPPKPTANTGWGDFVWQHRLGELLPDGEDQWWDVEAGMATERLADSIVEAITTYALPPMKEQVRS